MENSSRPIRNSRGKKMVAKILTKGILGFCDMAHLIFRLAAGLCVASITAAMLKNEVLGFIIMISYAGWILRPLAKLLYEEG